MGNARRSVTIFGGAGFIGANWAHHLLRQTDATVHIFDNLSRAGVRHNLEWLKQAAGASGRLQLTIGDVRDAAAVERAARNASEIYNFAAQVAVTTSVIDPRADFETNAAGTFNVLEAARKSGNNPFVLFTSTNKVYGDMAEHQLELRGERYCYRQVTGITEAQPLDFHSPYGCSKGSADQYVRDYARIYGLPTVVFRMSCIAGERQFGNEDQGWVAHFLYTALERKPLVIYGDGRQVRDVLWVGDLVRALEASRQNAARTAGEIYNVGGGATNTTSLLELIHAIEELSGERVVRMHDARRPGDQLVYVTDHAKLTKHTGWRPQSSVKQTLLRILDFWQENRALITGEVNVPDAAIPLRESVAAAEAAAPLQRTA